MLLFTKCKSNQLYDTLVRRKEKNVFLGFVFPF